VLELPIDDCDDCQVAVFDARGRHVRTLPKESATVLCECEAGWDRLDDAGTSVGVAPYFVCITNRSRAETNVVVLIP